MTYDYQDYEMYRQYNKKEPLTIEELHEMILNMKFETRDLYDNAITTEKIADFAVDYAKIAHASIGQVHIREASINNAHIQDLAVSRAKIMDAAIGSAQIDEAAINSAHIGHAAIQTAHIEDASVTMAKIKDLIVDSAQIADASITSAKIQEAAILSAHILDGEITNAKIAQAAIDSANIKDGAITNALIATGAIQTAQIADGSITDAKIVELTANKITAGILDVERLRITGKDSILYEINVNSVGELTASEVTLDGQGITERSITADKVVAKSITSAEIAARSITANELVANTITAASGVIANAAINTAQIADGSITDAKILNATITNAKLANATIQAAKIADAAITTAKINNLAVTAAKIADATITNAKIANTTITNAKIADATIQSAKIASLHGDKIQAGTINANRLQANTIIAGNIKFSGILEGASGNIKNIGSTYTSEIRNDGTFTIDGTSTVRDSTYLAAGLLRLTNPGLGLSGSQSTINPYSLSLRYDTRQIILDAQGGLVHVGRSDIHFSNGAVIHQFPDVGRYVTAIYPNGVGAGTDSGGILYLYAERDSAPNLKGGFRLFANGTEHIRGVNGITQFYGRVVNQDTFNVTTSANANMYVASNGYYARSSSSERYKQNIEDVNVDFMKIRNLKPRSWYDRGEVERNGGSTDGLKRYYGAIAEDFQKIGLPEYVVYNEETGDIENFNDRAWVLLIPVINVLYDKIEVLEQKLRSV